MSNAYRFFKKGKILFNKGRFVEAIMFLEKARDIEPEKGSIREILASAYYNCGFYDSARENFEAALRIDASNDFAHYGLGLCFLREKNLSGALGHFKIAAAMNPKSEKYKEVLRKFT